MCNDNPVSQCFCKALNDLLSSLWTVPYTFEEPMSDKPNEDFELDLRQISWAHFRVYCIEVVRHLCISILSGKNIYGNSFHHLRLSITKGQSIMKTMRWSYSLTLLLR